VTAALIAPASGHDGDGPRTKTHAHRHHDQAPGVRYFRSPDAIVERDRSEDDRGRCLGPVSGLGTQWIGIEGALKAARKDWMERVRYDHGESFVDLSHAAEGGSRCGRVSIGAFLGKVMYRCEVVARPCKARFEPGAAIKTAALAAPMTTLPVPRITTPPQATAPPAAKAPLAILRFFKLPRGHREPPPAPAAQPGDQRPTSARLAALFIGQIVVGTVGTMEFAPPAATSFAHKLLHAAFEFPMLYRALSISTSLSD
jgi:hypothetical protein